MRCKWTKRCHLPFLLRVSLWQRRQMSAHEVRGGAWQVCAVGSSKDCVNTVKLCEHYSPSTAPELHGSITYEWQWHNLTIKYMFLIMRGNPNRSISLFLVTKDLILTQVKVLSFFQGHPIHLHTFTLQCSHSLISSTLGGCSMAAGRKSFAQGHFSCGSEGGTCYLLHSHLYSMWRASGTCLNIPVSYRQAG